MKKLKSLIALVAIVLSLGLGACSKGNPAEQFASALNKLAEQAQKVKDQKDVEVYEKAVAAADEIVEENASYVLTPSDKEAIKDAMGKLMRASITRAFEMQGQKVPEDQLDMMVGLATAAIDKATTLGDISNGMNEPATLPDDVLIEETAVEVEEDSPAEL